MKKLLLFGLLLLATSLQAKLGYSPFGKKPFGSIDLGGGVYIDPFSRKKKPTPTVEPTPVPTQASAEETTPEPTPTIVVKVRSCVNQNVTEEEVAWYMCHTVAKKFFDEDKNGPFKFIFVGQHKDWMSVYGVIEEDDPILYIFQHRHGHWVFYMDSESLEESRVQSMGTKSFYVTKNGDYIPMVIISGEE